MRFIDAKGENYSKFVKKHNSKLSEFGKWGLYYAIPNNVEYFGLIVDEFNPVIPYIDTDEEDINNIIYGYTYLEREKEFELPTQLPFIFKIVSDESSSQEYAQELITGKKIRIQEPDEFFSLTDKMDNEGKARIYSYQAQYEERKNNPLMIIPRCPYYAVDNDFKAFYESKVRGHEQEIIDMIEKFDKLAKETFDLHEKELINGLETIAFTDNLMKNFENRSKKL